MINYFEKNDTISVLCAEPIAHLLDYKAPDEGCVTGDFVEVPLQRRKVLGVVWGAGCVDFDGDRLKKVYRVLDLPPMRQEMRLFLEYVASYNLASLGAVLRLATRVRGLTKVPEMRKFYYLSDVEPASNLTPTQKRVYSIFKECDGAKFSLSEIMQSAHVSASVVKGLLRKSFLCEESASRDASFPRLLLDEKTTILSAEQAQAAKKICAAIGRTEYKSFLLKGVTGSGKTEVYIEAIATCLKKGQMALVLMPEIGLTEVFLERIEHHFGVRPAEWHSGVGEAARRRCWKMVAQGRAQLVVGARSALFLPFKNLGLIIVDEEHDGSYKQEEGVRYNARDMAVLRASLAQAQVVLVSATPSLESWNNVQKGKYTLIDLPKRYNAAPLPHLEAIDMRTENLPSGRWISKRLKQAVDVCLEKGEQALLFLNRRGYAPITICRACSHHIACADCDSYLVEHRRLRQFICHQCGATRAFMQICPTCKAKGQLIAIGPGIERLGEEAKRLFPDARLLVMSSDLVASVRSIKDEIAAFARGDADIIIGTQLIAKGYNFPKLTLVGVIDADIGLQNVDLRASERNFQIIQQVCGRAGRAEKPGVGFLQTWQPENGVIKSIISYDIEGFWQAEAVARKIAKAPPFGRFVSIIVSAPILSVAEKFSMKMAQNIAPLRKIDAEIYGPAPAPIMRIRGSYRIRFLIKSALNAPVQNAVQQWLAQFRLSGGVNVVTDIDPQSFY